VFSSKFDTPLLLSKEKKLFPLFIPGEAILLFVKELYFESLKGDKRAY
jgi:hypothetical protein